MQGIGSAKGLLRGLHSDEAGLQSFCSALHVHHGMDGL